MEQEAVEVEQATDGETIENAIPGTIESGIERPNGFAKPLGYHPIDPATATPEETQQRLDYLFRQIKDQKRTDQTLRQYRDIAAEQARKLEELTNGMNGVVNHLQDKTYNETEIQLTQSMQAAFESGDTKAYIENQNKLLDIKTEKRLATLQKKNAPKQEAKPDALLDGPALSADDQFVVDTWQDEKDETGNTLRPWAHNRGTDENPDSDYLAALNETFAVLKNPKFKNATMEQKMAEVDRRMGVNKPESRQSVMGGGLTGGRKTGKITLSPKQQEIAIKTGSRDKTDAEKIDWYRKQLEKVNHKKGVKA